MKGDQNREERAVKPVLVTGATGLIGGYLVVALLERGDYHVKIAVRSRNTLNRLEFLLNHNDFALEQLEVIDAEIEDYQDTKRAVAGCEIVFHCAAIVSLGNGDESGMVATNVGITHNVVEACLEDPGKPLLVHISSVAALGKAMPGESLGEDSVFENISASTPYSRSKFLSENEIWRGISMGLKAVVVNPSVVLGYFPGGGELQAIIEYVAKEGLKYYTSGVCGYVDVRDVADAMIELSLRPDAWEQRYILSGYNLSFKDLIGMFNKAFGHPEPKYKLGPRLLFLVQFLINLSGKITHKQVVPNIQYLLMSRRTYDGTLIYRKIGFGYRSPGQTVEKIKISLLSARRIK